MPGMEELALAMQQAQGAQSPDPQQQMMALMQALAAKQAEAQSGADQAGQQYQEAAAAPNPGLNPLAALSGGLLPDLASIISGNKEYGQRGHQQVKQAQADLMQKRADNLTALAAAYEQKSKAAKEIGNKAMELEFEEKKGKVQQQHETVLKNMVEHGLNTREAAGNTSAEKIAAGHDTAGLAEARIRSSATSGPGGITSTDTIKTLADGMESGKLTPEFNYLGQKGAGGLVKAELVKRGVNVTKLVARWNSEKRAIQTLKGPQQLRMKQAIDNLSASLDRADQLNDELTAAIPAQFRTQFPEVNSVTLGLAKSGKFGPEAQSAATKLGSQVTLLGNEIGNVTMGGNSPTDQAVRHGRDVLSKNWSQKQFKDSVQLVRDNVTYRQNAMDASQAEWAPDSMTDEDKLDSAKQDAMTSASTGNFAKLTALIKANPALNDDPELLQAVRTAKGVK